MRKLTGKWYLKKCWFNYKIIVETIQQTQCEFDFSFSPEFTKWEKATNKDIIELNIKAI